MFELAPLMRVAGRMARMAIWPFGHLLFITGLGVLSLAGVVLGERHDLGKFLKSTTSMIWECEHVMFRGYQTALGLWAVTFTLIDWHDHAGDRRPILLSMVALMAMVCAWRVLTPSDGSNS
jgi:hypothetical protein